MEPTEKLCPFCAEPIKAEAIRCKHCQADLSQSSAAQSISRNEAKGMGVIAKICLTALALFIAFLAFGFYVGSTPEGKAKARARDAIELCRKEERTYTGSSDARSIISGACRKLDADFRARFGHAP
ncbi:Uncharacterised protein [Pseudomonas putida]|nr:Uncharacterised protein [Pseudomonas putida]CAB5577893.1 Uncharacterised protein [Pseudomonas putida]CAB5621014.1 Uncharacterised protein [Pseudomonas putida]CAB5622527.1 Uncharacterised protein [Pseudomonas putida]CAB5702398.1 Uncharacterised protein [Pseudomonas putida]